MREGGKFSLSSDHSSAGRAHCTQQGPTLSLEHCCHCLSRSSIHLWHHSFHILDLKRNHISFHQRPSASSMRDNIPFPFLIIHSPQAVLSHYKAHRDRQKPCQTGELNSQLWVFLSFQDQVVLHYLILFCTCHLSFSLTPSHSLKFKQSLNFRCPYVFTPKDPSLVFLNCIPEEMEE